MPLVLTGVAGWGTRNASRADHPSNDHAAEEVEVGILLSTFLLLGYS